jgi:histidinol-phosphate/aromatic aminotransferase/cobyric acid decarboxylase-like protein
VEKERTWIREQLPFLHMTGEANYLFFSAEKPLWKECKKHGIFIRDCRNFVSLEQKYYCRTAVKKREENEQLVKLLSSLG